MLWSQIVSEQTEMVSSNGVWVKTECAAILKQESIFNSVFMICPPI